MDDAPVLGCMLRMRRNTRDEAGRCVDDCSRCGWNQKVAAERKKKIRAKYGNMERTEIRCPFCQGRIVL